MFRKSHENSPAHNSTKHSTAKDFVSQLLDPTFILTPDICHELLLFLQYVFSEEVVQTAEAKKEEILQDIINI